jgi:hypothetical protein
MAFAVTFCFFSCEKEPEPLTTNSCITGRVYVNDYEISSLPPVKIVASGPYGSETTYTDTEGIFWFRNMGNGTYTVECSLQGYGSTKKFGVQVFGKDTAYVYMETLYLLPASSLKAPTITNIMANSDYNLYLSTSITNCETDHIPLRLFFSSNNKVTCDDYEATDLGFIDWQCQYYCYLYGLQYRTNGLCYRLCVQ